MKNNKTLLQLGKNWVFPLLLGSLIALPIIAKLNAADSDSYNKNNDDKFLSPMKLAQSTKLATNSTCVFGKKIKHCFKPKQALCEADLKVAKIAWKYFENNYQPTTGLFNAVNKFPSTTMWDTGSALAATIAAQNLGIISDKEFDDKITALIRSLVSIELFNGIAPNKVYNSKTLKMVTYANKVTKDGIGVSVLDMARLKSWLNTLSCMHPKYKHQVDLVTKRWKLERLIKDGQMISLKRDTKTGKIKSFQEGRLGYEQYAAKILERNGFDLPVSSTYNNRTRQNVEIYDVSIATDNRTPNKFHANNSVVTESYVMDAVENGYDTENRPLIDNVFLVQKRRWQKEGIITAVSEDNIKKKPYFVYNTIFSGGDTWVAKSSKGEILKSHQTVSTKAAMALAALYPDDEYSTVLVDKVKSAYDPEKGWYSGIYENGEGYNKSITANTNGVILSLLLYKKYGSTSRMCNGCQKNKIMLVDSAQQCGGKSTWPQ